MKTINYANNYLDKIMEQIVNCCYYMLNNNNMNYDSQIYMYSYILNLLEECDRTDNCYKILRQFITDNIGQYIELFSNKTVNERLSRHGLSHIKYFKLKKLEFRCHFDQELDVLELKRLLFYYDMFRDFDHMYNEMFSSIGLIYKMGLLKSSKTE